MSNDKHQALRDAIGHVWAPTSLYTHTIWEKEATPDRVNALLADHDRMREALQRIVDDESCDYATVFRIADECMKECGR